MTPYDLYPATPKPCARTAASGFEPPVIARLLDMPCPVERGASLRQQLVALGFDRLGVMGISVAGPRPVPLALHGDPRVSAWPAEYLRERHFEVDPRLDAASESGMPCVWDIEGLQRESLRRFDDARRAQALVDGLAAHGIASGLMVAVRCPLNAQVRLASLLSRRRGRGWMDEAVLGQAQWLAIYAAQHPPTGLAQTPTPALADGTDSVSELQRHILDCLRLGLADKVIADRLGMTTHNVDYHLRRLRQRFGVRNRVQLVQAARSVA